MITRYYKCSEIEKVFINQCGFTLKEMYTDVKNMQMVYSLKMIKHYLNVKKQEKTNEYFKALGRNITGDEVLKFNEQLDGNIYQIDPYMIEYYKKYISVLKRKILRLLDIMIDINNNNFKDIDIVLEELDVNIIYTDGYIMSEDDMKRLIEPTIYNFKQLLDKVTEANNLDTYLNKKITKERHSTFSEEEIYPTLELQSKNIYLSVCVALSQRQLAAREKLEEDLLEKEKKLVKYNIF